MADIRQERARAAAKSGASVTGDRDAWVADRIASGKAMGVSSKKPSRGADASVEAADVYRRFLDALNRQDLAAAEACVDPARYRENCVGFTDGYVDWAGATASVQTIWKGLPDLHVELHNLAAGADFVVGRGTVSGTALGRLYGAPATKHRYQATSTTSASTSGESSNECSKP